MISRKYRFSGQGGLRYVYRKGSSVRTKHCAAKFIVNTRSDTWRVSVVVSKKVAKSAPLRNRIRRRLYEQVRLQAPKYLKNQDVVITVFDQDLAFMESVEIEQLVTRVLKTISTPTR
jgi:ribonuclease P protein component